MSDSIRVKFKGAADSDSDIVIMRPRRQFGEESWVGWAYLHEDVVFELFGGDLMEAVMASPDGVIVNVSVEIEE